MHVVPGAAAHRKRAIEEAALHSVSLGALCCLLALNGLFHAHHAAHPPLQQFHLCPPSAGLC